MTLLAKLNRRHKAALFVILLASGGSLIAGVGIQVTMGITLLGVALGWAFGSDSRAVHWLFVVSGSGLLLGPVGFDWYSKHEAGKAYENEITAFEHKIPELAKKYPYKKTATDPQTGARMGWNGAMWVVFSAGSGNHKIGDEWDGTVRKGDRSIKITPELLSGAIGKGWSPDGWIAEPGTPKWVSDALLAGVDVDIVPGDEKPAYSPPRSFSLGSALAEGVLFEVPGLFLLGAGLGLIFGVRRQARQTYE